MPLPGLLQDRQTALETLGDLCGHLQGSAEELENTRGKLGLLVFPQLSW